MDGVCVYPQHHHYEVFPSSRRKRNAAIKANSSRENNRDNLENFIVTCRRNHPISYKHDYTTSTNDQVYHRNNTGSCPIVSHETSSYVSSLSVDGSQYHSDTESIGRHYSPRLGRQNHHNQLTLNLKRFLGNGAADEQFRQNHRPSYERRALEKNRPPQIYERTVSCPTISHSKQNQEITAQKKNVTNDRDNHDNYRRRIYRRSTVHQDYTMEVNYNYENSDVNLFSIQFSGLNSSSILPPRSASDSCVLDINESSLYRRSNAPSTFKYNSAHNHIVAAESSNNRTASKNINYQNSAAFERKADNIIKHPTLPLGVTTAVLV